MARNLNKRTISQARYKSSDKYKSTEKAYSQSAARKAFLKKYYKTNKYKTYLKKYNKSSNHSKSQQKYYKKMLKTDLKFKLVHNLRVRLNCALKRNFKSGSAVRDLGCTISELKLHLESKFLIGMTWNNYGNKEGQWSIDHIIPLSKVDLTDKEQLLKVCHYTNLQPMWHEDNLKKGNKI